MKSPNIGRTIASSHLALLTMALLFIGCGKAPNKQKDILLDFPSIMPERPVAMLAPNAEPWTSGRALAVHDAELFAVDTLNGNLVVLDRDGLDVVRVIPVGDRPEQVVVGPTGIAYVTVRGSGEVVRIEPNATIVSQRALVGTDPYGIALSPSSIDRAMLLVTCSGDNKILALDPSTLEVTDQAESLEDPRGLAFSFTGYVTIAHVHAPALTFPLTEDGEFGVPVGTELRIGNPSDHFFLQGRIPGLIPTRALAATVNPDTGEALIAHVQASPGTEEELFNRPDFDDTPEVDDSGYGSASRQVDFNIPVRPISTSVTTVGNTDDDVRIVASPPVQDPGSGEPMLHLVDSPSDINHHPTHTLAFVVGEGSDNVLVLNTRGTDPLSSPLAEIKVGMAPKAVAFTQDGSTAYVLNGHSFTISEIDVQPFFDLPVVSGGQGLSANLEDAESTMFGLMPDQEEFADEESHKNRNQTVVERTGTELSADITQPVTLTSKRERSFGDDPRTDTIRRGQRLFTFARSDSMSHAGMFSCSTCHLEGREDKLVWVVPEGLRQTPSLAQRLKGTAPFNWNGDNDVLQNNMVQTIGRLGGLGLKKHELVDLEQFMLEGLIEPTNPHLSPEGLTDEQELGRKLFNDPIVACGSCHVNGAGVDGESHDVGSMSQLEVEIAQHRQDMDSDVAFNEGRYNTPSLKGAWHTAPYLHDGSAATLMEVLDRTSKTMGRTDHLSIAEKMALIAYIKTL